MELISLQLLNPGTSTLIAIILQVMTPRRPIPVCSKGCGDIPPLFHAAILHRHENTLRAVISISEMLLFSVLYIMKNGIYERKRRPETLYISCGIGKVW
ncbi:MAG: hypothetical protein WA144_00465 [Candidatus Methanoperedens sp.]